MSRVVKNSSAHADAITFSWNRLPYPLSRFWDYSLRFFHFFLCWASSFWNEDYVMKRVWNKAHHIPIDKIIDIIYLEILYHRTICPCVHRYWDLRNCTFYGNLEVSHLVRAECQSDEAMNEVGYKLDRISSSSLNSSEMCCYCLDIFEVDITGHIRCGPLLWLNKNISEFFIVINMECKHCGHIMTFIRTTDRASGRQVEVFKCSFCGLIYQDPRPNPQTQR